MNRSGSKLLFKVILTFSLIIVIKKLLSSIKLMYTLILLSPEIALYIRILLSSSNSDDNTSDFVKLKIFVVLGLIGIGRLNERLFRLIMLVISDNDVEKTLIPVLL